MRFLIAAAVVILVWVLPSYLVARHAGRKGHSFAAFLLAGLLVSWVISGIAALLVGDVDS